MCGIVQPSVDIAILLQIFFFKNNLSYEEVGNETHADYVDHP